MAIDRTEQNWPSELVHRISPTQDTINKAVIRNDTGNLVVRQCHPKTTVESVKTQSRIAFDGKTVGDILSRLQMNQRLYKIVMDKR